MEKYLKWNKASSPDSGQCSIGAYHIWTPLNINTCGFRSADFYFPPTTNGIQTYYSSLKLQAVRNETNKNCTHCFLAPTNHVSWQI